MRFAFKEWAVICRALALGRQSLILRKGGIAESAGRFRLDHPRFWLYPTGFHEHREAIKPSAHDLFVAESPPPGIVPLRHFAEVTDVASIHDWGRINSLDNWHVWTSEAVRKKFEYRQPGLFVLIVRIFTAPHAVDLAETPAFAGCKTWVELTRDLPATPGRPVLADTPFNEIAASIRQHLAEPPSTI